MKIFDDNSIKAIDKVVRTVQSDVHKLPYGGDTTAATSRRTVWVQATSATINANGYYPAKFQYRSGSTTWVDFASGTCWLESSFAPDITKTYECSVTHVHTDNKAVCRMHMHGLLLLTVQNSGPTAVNQPTTLQFFPSTGITVSTASGTLSNVFLLDASSTQVGVVNLVTGTPQQLGNGPKTIGGFLNIVNPTTATVLSGDTLYLNVNTSGGVGSRFGVCVGTGTAAGAQGVYILQPVSFTGICGAVTYGRPNTGVRWPTGHSYQGGAFGATPSMATGCVDDALGMYEIVGPFTRTAYSIVETDGTTATRYVGRDGTIVTRTATTVITDYFHGGIYYRTDTATVPPPPPPALVPPVSPASVGSLALRSYDAFGTALTDLQLPDPDISTTAYTASTRVLALKANAQTKNITLPLFSSSDPGLTPSSGGGTANFLRADGTWAAPPSGAPGNFPVTNVSSSVTISFNRAIRVTNSGIANTLTLPSAATAGIGAWIFIQDAGGTAASGNISVLRAGSDTINGSTTAVVAINTNYGGVWLIATGATEWTMS